MAAQKNPLKGLANHKYKHGHVGTGDKSPTYNTWLTMKQRCLNSKDPRYSDYGGRGIIICAAWLDFSNFLRDMGVRPAKTSIDRINTNGNYEPGNCRWATRKEQQRNMRSSRMIEFRGVTKSLSAWAEELGIHKGALQARINRDWPIERAMTEAVTRFRPYHGRKVAPVEAAS